MNPVRVSELLAQRALSEERHANHPDSRVRFLLGAEITGGWSTPASSRTTAGDAAPVSRESLAVLARAQRYRRTFVAGLGELICHFAVPEVRHVPDAM
jgi:hypothetical protein